MSSLTSQSEDTHQIEKRELRRLLRARRRALPRWKQQHVARRLASIVTRQTCYRRSRTIAAYLSNDAEIDPIPLLDAAHAAGKCILLPRLREKHLEFAVYRPGGSGLRRNRFNIPEPIGPAVSLKRIDIVFMPLVGFDRQGGRLGMGGGFYDRTFSKAGKRNADGPRLIGLAYACQEVARLPHEEWDVRMTVVVTEQEWIRTR